ncbi:MAG: Maf family protein [Acidobacteriota bacterium]
MIAMPTLVLASASPRRAEILRNIGWPFEAVAANIDESRFAHEDAPTYVTRVARAKAEEVRLRVPGATIVAADTVVVVDGEILGKPRDDEDARRMLRLLQGRNHEVLTGVTVFNGSTVEPGTAYAVTEVSFADMDEDEVEWYVSSGEPMDKAGAYAIQGLGARFIKGIKGEYSNVVGLPVRLLYELISSGPVFKGACPGAPPIESPD